MRSSEEKNLKQGSDAVLEKWTPLATDVEEARVSAPVHVILGEAIDVASLLSHYWEPKQESRGVRIPGFAGVAAASALTKELPTEIRELQPAARGAAPREAERGDCRGDGRRRVLGCR